MCLHLIEIEWNKWKWVFFFLHQKIIDIWFGNLIFIKMFFFRSLLMEASLRMLCLDFNLDFNFIFLENLTKFVHHIWNGMLNADNVKSSENVCDTHQWNKYEFIYIFRVCVGVCVLFFRCRAYDSSRSIDDYGNEINGISVRFICAFIQLTCSNVGNLMKWKTKSKRNVRNKWIQQINFID